MHFNILNVKVSAHQFLLLFNWTNFQKIKIKAFFLRTFSAIFFPVKCWISVLLFVSIQLLDLSIISIKPGPYWLLVHPPPLKGTQDHISLHVRQQSQRSARQFISLSYMY